MSDPRAESRARAVAPIGAAEWAETWGDKGWQVGVAGTVLAGVLNLEERSEAGLDVDASGSTGAKFGRICREMLLLPWDSWRW